jgi:hypothetical protein
MRLGLDVYLLSKYRWGVNNGIEAELLKWNRQKLYKRFCVHRLFDGTNILTEHVSAVRVCLFLRKDFFLSL